VRFLKWSIILAVALVILKSNAWYPHILKGNELKLVRGSCDCEGSKKPDKDAGNCSSNCSGTTYDKCKTGSSSEGCYCIGVNDKCGQTAQEEDCGGEVCGSCTPH
jgi:hypothetical protein